MQRLLRKRHLELRAETIGHSGDYSPSRERGIHNTNTVGKFYGEFPFVFCDLNRGRTSLQFLGKDRTRDSRNDRSDSVPIVALLWQLGSFQSNLMQADESTSNSFHQVFRE